MDAMDFTMDSPSPHNAAPVCPYMQNPSLPPIPNYHSQLRDAHHYDPVHNTETWYPHVPSSNAPPSWAPHSGPAFPPLGSALQDMSGVRSTGGFMGTPPLSFRDQYSVDSPFSYRDRFHGSNPAVEHRPGRSSVPAPSTPAPASHRFNRLPHVSMQPFLAEYARRHRPNGATIITTDSSATDRSRRDALERIDPSVDSTAGSGRRSIRTSRGDSHMAGRRRRVAFGYLANEALGSDEEGSSEEIDVEVYRRSQEWLLHPESDREHFLAAARGRLGTGKRVPSKEAMASLENVKTEDLTTGDRNCIICYNEFGIENPEGLVESPLRLPRCKHVFGDKCIKKWFEDNDSCPYCRDKLPSELTVSRTSTLETLRMREQRLTAAHRARLHYISRLPSALEAHHPFLNEGRTEVDDQSRTASTTYAPPPLVHSNSSPSRPMDESHESRRRRQRRPLEVTNRPTTLQNGRPTSFGSARLTYPSMYQFSSPSVATTSGTPGAGGHVRLQQDENAFGRPVSPGHDSSSSDEASPAVAIGSNILQSHVTDSHLPHFHPQWRESLISSFGDRSAQPFNSGVLPPLRTNHNAGNPHRPNSGFPASSPDNIRNPGYEAGYDPQYDSAAVSLNRFRNSLLDNHNDSQPRWSH